MICLATYLVRSLEARVEDFAMRAMLVLCLLAGSVCSELLAIGPVDPQAPEYGTAPGPEVENDISGVPVFTPVAKAVPPNCDHTREVAGQVGRYQIHGDYRLDTVTGEVVRVADIVKEVAVAAPSSATFTLRVTSGVDTIHEAVVPVFAVDGDSILTVDIQEALGIWLRTLIGRVFMQPVSV